MIRVLTKETQTLSHELLGKVILNGVVTARLVECVKSKAGPPARGSFSRRIETKRNPGEHRHALPESLTGNAFDNHQGYLGEQICAVQASEGQYALPPTTVPQYDKYDGDQCRKKQNDKR